ncbi:phosphate signaling complex protein PhoU [Usitatibacter palustris]|uniref:Phosphate-specific transport system accessory protein PhoU n=1 Tax=Usitatibacter palustris TaxID=2732487 RepID=A0A6M4HD00_9PROT|nr:phosphate signaling complex protein PhoU [Usitatibacter palustris]QJR16423.1 Phosphate-specific transport system accessory protein PhoU [Usitatibacter palustris]
MVLNTQEHTSKRYDAELETVRSRVLQMGGLVESQISSAINALSTGNVQLADQVIADDDRVNALEVQIDEDCSHIIARRQPAAQDLRMVIMVIKMITDLERIGDEAEKIARMTKLIYSSERLTLPRFTEVKIAAGYAIDMLKKSLDAFARIDLAAAASVVRQDRLLDDQFRGILRQLITFMMEDARTISTSIEILFVAKALERIGDHAKNMAEYVVYLVKGKDVRHVTEEEFEREASSD